MRRRFAYDRLPLVIGVSISCIIFASDSEDLMELGSDLASVSRVPVVHDLVDSRLDYLAPRPYLAMELSSEESR